MCVCVCVCCCSSPHSLPSIPPFLPLPSPPTSHFVRNVGPRMSRQLPWGQFFVLNRFLTVPGLGGGPWRPKT